MKFSFLAKLLAGSQALVSAMPSAVPAHEATFEITDLVTEMFEEQFFPYEVASFQSLISKRDTTTSIEHLLNLLNSSDIVFMVLDQIAYNPARIQKLANYTSRAIGSIDIGSMSNVTKGLNIKLDVNGTAMYNEVMNSGVVTSLLDGLLLDASFRPVLVKVVSRLLEGNKNLINYMIKNVFKSSKRDQILQKRANSGTLETFVGNVISTVLSSKLVGNVASDVLVALNETQFLTTTAKRLIANEGYQNMTAQLVLDMLNTGSIKFDSKSINITSIADKVLSRPQVLVTIVSNILSGRVSLPALGKYNSAVSEILRGVENNGVFADLNKYVFSETHSATQPLLPTQQIVVPRNTSSRTTTTTSKTTSASSKSISSSNSSTMIQPSSVASSVISSLSSQLSSISIQSFSFNDASTTASSRTATSTISGSGSASSGGSDAEVASILSVLRGLDSGSQTASASATTSTNSPFNLVFISSTLSTSTTSSGTNNILNLIQALGSASSTSQAKRAEPSTANVHSGARGSAYKTSAMLLVLIQGLLISGLLML